MRLYKGKARRTNPTGLDSVHGVEPARRLTCLPYHLVNSKQQEIYDGNPNLENPNLEAASNFALIPYQRFMWALVLPRCFSRGSIGARGPGLPRRPTETHLLASG